MPSCLRKIRPRVRRNSNTMRTRRGRIYYVPWHVRRFDIQENCSYRSGKSMIFWAPPFSMTKAMSSLYVNAFSF